MTFTACPSCGCERFFGPAEIVLGAQHWEYVSCQRCGGLLLVGRDVEVLEEREEVRP